MALKKSDLYSSLWSACDDLRGPMEPGQYKDYVLVLLFIKYISDKYKGQKFSPITIPDGASFADMAALKGNDAIGDLINTKIIAPLANANGLSDMPDFNDPSKLGSGKEMVERLTNLIALFEDPRLDFSKNRAEGDDILGDAYEYLMRHFATESGKSKGQFYTPSEVSRIMARLVGIDRPETTNATTVYDPTCGSGSLLLKVADEASQISGAKVTLYGQENEATTAGLARMNMILHDNPTADIRQGNTITDPKFKDGPTIKTFDYVVANPPFSDKRWSTGLTGDNDYGRYTTYGKPPPKQGDYAYLLHIIASLKTSGHGACILPHGVLFRGNAEAVIRRNLVERGFIKAIVGLPTNLFFGTGIPACIVVIDKQNAPGRKGIFMIDASKGFMKDGPKNRLREQDIHRIVDTFQRLADVPGYARMVPLTEISDPSNDFNLNLPRYIASTETEDVQDIAAHLLGGIPARDVDLLSPYWAAMPGLRNDLFEDFGRSGYLQLKVPLEEIRSLITHHPDFKKFNSGVQDLFAAWRSPNQEMLTKIKVGDSPKHLIDALSESLLSAFSSVALIDPYDFYQGLMEYWAATMQDDAYMIAYDGWTAAAKPRQITQVKDKNNKNVWSEDHDFVISKARFKSDLLPASIVIEDSLSTKRDDLTVLKQALEVVEESLESAREEHAVEGGLLEDVADLSEEKAKIQAKDVNKWLKENEKDPDLKEEIVEVERYRGLLAQQTDLKAKVKSASEALDNDIAAAYLALSEQQIIDLVVNSKWMTCLTDTLSIEVGCVERTLAERLVLLSARYGESLPNQEKDLEALTALVNEHLMEMRS